MPSPLGHGLAGLTIHVLTARGRDERHDVARTGIAVAAATAPDLDLILRLFDGRNHHQGVTHSLVGVIAAALIAAAVASRRHARQPSRWAVLVGLAWGSHLLLDFLGRDTTPPIGIPVLWPARLYFHSPSSVFFDIGRKLDWATVGHDAVAMAWEVAILLPILAVSYRWRARRAT